MLRRLKNDKNMQLRLIFSTVALALAATPLCAQQPAKATARLVNDTIVLNTNMPPVKSPLLASNLSVSSAASAKAGEINKNEDIKPGYGPVPLAGEEAYFGDKSDFVKDYTLKYLAKHTETLDHVKNNSSKPFEVIDKTLEQKHMPKELKYLAVIESALNHNAVSHAGAVGTWQLMGTTARMMGLSVNMHQDDRRDLYKSTQAATKYLELLYSQLNDWLLVIAAYNSGPTPVQRAIEKTGSHNFWDIKKYLPAETQGHVLAFIATASIFENLSKFINLGSVPVDFKFGKEEEPMELPMAKSTLAAAVPSAVGAVANTATVAKKSPFTEEELKNMSIIRITEPLYMELMAQELGVDKKTLSRWNPDYDMFVYKTYPTPYYSLRIPKDKLSVFLQKKDEMTRKSKAIFSQITKQ
jgi:membrane-bound lytic murein transglycosylase D